jgi:O-antigen/teichoic acid export membrane protein
MNSFVCLLSHLKNSSFVKNVFIVMSGTVLGQAVGFFLLPVISRLFTPADFGVFGSFNAVVNVVAAGVTLDYSQAIMLPKEKNDAMHLFFLSCLSTLFVTFLCLMATLVAHQSFMALVKAQNMWILLLFVLTIMISGLNVSLQAWGVRAKAFKQTSVTQLIRSLSSSSMQVGLGFFKTGSIGLILSSVLADLIASLNLLIIFLNDFKISIKKIDRIKLRQLAKEYRDFPIYSASQNVINALSSGLPVLLLTHFFGISIAGAYAFGVRLLTTPMGLITGAMRQVLFQKASETQHNGGSLIALYLKVTVGLFALGLLPTLILIIWAPEIFSFIFGIQWHNAGLYARWLILWMLFVFCNVPAILYARIIRIQRTVFFYDMILLVARTTVLVIGGLYLTASQSIALFSIIGASMNLLLIILVGYHVAKKEGDFMWRHSIRINRS